MCVCCLKIANLGNMKVQFYIQTDKDPAPIYVRFNDGRKFDLRTKTGLVISPKNWSSDKWKPGEPKTNNRDAASKSEANSISKLLSGIELRIKEAYNNTKNKTDINKYWIEGIFRPQSRRGTVPGGLVDYFEYYRENKLHELKTPSLRKLGVVKNLLIRMERYYGTVYQIKDVDQNFYTAFVKFSAAHNYAHNTTARAFKLIKTLCYDAESNGIEISPKLKRITVKYKVVEKVYLTPEELVMIENKEMKLEALSNAKDWLLISCETGQRVSDFLRFEKSMIRKEAGKHLIEFTQKKTGKIMTIPLSKRVLAILKKNGGEFPRKVSEPRYNEYIKQVCKQAGLTYKIKGSKVATDEEGTEKRKESGMFPKWQLVTSHIGRRTFATNNYGRIPTSLLIAATGHATEKMFLEYIGKTDTQKALQLADYF